MNRRGRLPGRSIQELRIRRGRDIAVGGRLTGIGASGPQCAATGRGCEQVLAATKFAGHTPRGAIPVPGCELTDSPNVIRGACRNTKAGSRVPVDHFWGFGEKLPG